MANIFAKLPLHPESELFYELLRAENVRIERIVSRGHTSPEQGWYDQIENEWVIVLEGAGVVLFEDGVEVALHTGDYVNIPAHTRHKVAWTDPDVLTVWLAIFYS
ncbi:MAG: cupin domain-containing protein [Gallionella sp.]|jgi:cupin 2 domain-containing protein